MLDQLVTRAAARRPEALAVRGTDGALSYGALDARANQVARAPHAGRCGRPRRSRRHLASQRSRTAVAAMQGVLRLGAAYVPVDLRSPPARAATVMSDCGVRALIARPDAALGVLGHIGRGALRAFRRRARRLDALAGVLLGPRSQADDPPGRPRLHPLHVRVDGAPQGRLHFPLKCQRIRGMGRGGSSGPGIPIGSRTTPRFTSICRFSTSMPPSPSARPSASSRRARPTRRSTSSDSCAKSASPSGTPFHRPSR